MRGDGRNMLHSRSFQLPATPGSLGERWGESGELVLDLGEVVLSLCLAAH
jgi:hypothetical protein